MAVLTWRFPFVRRGNSYPGDNPALEPYEPSFGYAYSPDRSLSGITINEDTAITISTVWRAVQLIASTIAALPLRLLEENAEGSTEQVKYEQFQCIWRRPNSEVSRIVFWETAIGHEVLNGNCFILVKKTNPATLWLIQPERVEVARDDTGTKYYRIDGDDKTIRTDYVRGGDIIHITGWGRNGLVGISPIRAMGNTLGLAKAAEDFASTFFANGSTLGGVLSTDMQLAREQSQELKGRWDDAHKGIQNAHETAVLSHGLKWQSTTVEPEKGQMLDTRQFQVAEVARMFGVPEHLVGSHDKTSSWGQGLEVNNRAFIQYGLMPHILRFEQTISDEFLPEGVFIKWGIEGLLRGTSAERTQFYTAMFQIGAITTNQILKLEDLPTIGEEGDIRFIANNNLVPLESLQAPLPADDPSADGPGAPLA